MQPTEYCQNCGRSLNGPFCSNCGQRAKTPIVSLREFISNALSDLFSADSRIWRTILPLFFRPGKLTCEYLAGRRGRYLPPFRIYLILSLLFFVIASVVGEGLIVTAEDPSLLIDVPTTSIETNDEDDEFSCEEIELDGIRWLNNLDLETRARGACEKIRIDSGDSLADALVDNIPMMMFFFIPLVALLMQVLYLFSRRKYVEHLLFLFHYHAFFFMILTVIVITAALARSFPALTAPETIVTTFGWIYIPAYLLIAMRRVYQQSWFLTSVKYVLLLAAYAITLSVAFAAAATYTALTL